MTEEWRDKQSKDFDFTDWRDEDDDAVSIINKQHFYNITNNNISFKKIPQQNNGYDCGVFTCTFMEFFSRREPVGNFSQKNIENQRLRIVYEIMMKKLLDRQLSGKNS